MKIANLHRWDLSPTEAKKVQLKLAQQVVYENEIEQINFVAGIDVGFNLKRKISKAALALLSYPNLNFIEATEAELTTVFPYIPGFLSFREAISFCISINLRSIFADYLHTHSKQY